MTYPTQDANERPGNWVYVGANNGDHGDDDEYIYVPTAEELADPFDYEHDGERQEREEYEALNEEW